MAFRVIKKKSNLKTSQKYALFVMLLFFLMAVAVNLTFQDSWTLDLKLKMQKFLSASLKMPRVPRLLSIFVSFYTS